LVVVEHLLGGVVEGGDCAERLAAEEDEGAAQRLPGVGDDGVGVEGVERGGRRRAEERAQAAPRRVHAVEAAPAAVAARVRDVAERAVVEGALALDVDPRLVEQPGEVEVVRLGERGVRRRSPHPPADGQVHGARAREGLPLRLPPTLTYLPPAGLRLLAPAGLRSSPGAGGRASGRSGRGGDRGREAEGRQAAAGELGRIEKGDRAARISMRWRPGVE
jgi:hypothetical protein